MNIWKLSLKSLWHRKTTALLTTLSIAISVSLLLGVERLRVSAQESFQNTISGTDLIIGARTGPIQLLLYSVFRMGNATNNISWESYTHFAKHAEVKWTIPISLGDSHRGYRVVGTNQDYFQHYRYARTKNLKLKQGKWFSDLFDVVLGADVAAELAYSLGKKLVLSHGIDEAGFQKHTDKPFSVSGILARTGTPVDRSIHVSLEAIEAIHLGWEKGVAPSSKNRVSAETASTMLLQPQQITAFLVGLKTKLGIFQIQREVNEYREEALMGILPGASFAELWKTVNVVERGLLAISFLVVLSGLLGMVTTLLTSLNERRREMAILRSVGAPPSQVFFLLIGEAIALTVSGITLGLAVLYGALWIAQPILLKTAGIWVSLSPPNPLDFKIMCVILLAGVLVGMIPAWLGYRRSLSDGLSIKV